MAQSHTTEPTQVQSGLWNVSSDVGTQFVMNDKRIINVGAGGGELLQLKSKQKE